MSIDLSLDRIRILFDRLPRYDRPTCHIAGTNGKGSVSAFLASILRSSSYRVGRYNSPHLVSVYDCITIDDVPVTPTVYNEVRAGVEKANNDHVIGATGFEVLTLTALQIFQVSQVDIVVVEVGMGGRLDATNVIPNDCILVSSLTSVDLDHQAFLGNIVADIAREKVGIARPGKPFILAPQNHASVSLIVQEGCEKAGADLLQAIVPSPRPWDEATDGPKRTQSVLTVERFLPLEPQAIQVSLPCFPEPIKALLPLQGKHQLANLGTALTTVSTLLTHPSCLSNTSLDLKSHITLQSVRKGIESTVWNGRLSFHKVALPVDQADAGIKGQELLVLVDGAHNAASSVTLSAYITDVLARTRPTPYESRRPTILTYIIALSDSPPKTPSDTIKPLLPTTIPKDYAGDVRLNIAVVRFTPPNGMPWVKSVPPSRIRESLGAFGDGPRLWCAKDDDPPEGQLLQALKWASEDYIQPDGQLSEGMIVVAGSLYLVADFYRLVEKTGEHA